MLNILLGLDQHVAIMDFKVNGALVFSDEMMFDDDENGDLSNELKYLSNEARL